MHMDIESFRPSHPNSLEMLLLSILNFIFVLSSIAHAWSPLHILHTRQQNRAQNTRRTCKKIQALTALSALATNQTQLDRLFAKGKMNEERRKWLMSEASNISLQLQTLTSNTTLVTECTTINAQRKDAARCRRLKKLEKLVSLANNHTALDEHLGNEILNPKQADELRRNLKEAPAKLESLKRNETLVAFCMGNNSSAVNAPLSGVIGNGKALSRCLFGCAFD